MTRHHQDLELLISRCSVENHSFIVPWGEFGPTLEDVVSLTSLHLCGIVKAMGMVLEEGDEDKLQQLTFAMASFMTPVKSTNSSWIRYFEEGEGSQCALVLGTLFSYLLIFVCFARGPEDWLSNYVFLRKFNFLTGR